MTKKNVSHLICYTLSVLFLTGCNSNKQSSFSQNTPPQPDYSKDFSWVEKNKTPTKPVDVFYVYPTIYVGTNPKNMNIADTKLRNAAKGLLTAQASVYSEYANLFAPFYRQQSAACQSMEAGNGGKDGYKDPLFQIGAKDIERAFDYYIKHLNPNRPFIIAGHSQGTMTLINLMRNRFNNPELQKRLVAAYLIGYSVTENDLKTYPWMKPAQGETDTGVIISFNTEGKKAGPSPVLLPEAITINPLNWKTDETPAERSVNLGAEFFNDFAGRLIEEIPHFAGAYNDTEKGVLIATEIQTPKSKEIDLVNMGRWPEGVYHRYDYSFWFNNIKANVKKRIDSYLKK